MYIRTLLLTLLAAAVMMIGTSQAAYVYFDNNTTDGKYEEPLNWYDGTSRYLPTTGDYGLISSGLTATLATNVSTTVPSALYVGYDSTDFTTVLGDGTLEVNAAASNLQVGGALYLGYGNSATAPCTGALNLSAGSIATTSSTYVGYVYSGSTAATGIYTQTGGAYTSGSSFYLGRGENADGTATISGDDSQLNVSGTYLVSVAEKFL